MKIVVPMTPIPCPRPRGKQGQRAYYPSEYQEWKRAAVMFLQRYGIRTEGPVTMSIRLEAEQFTVEIHGCERSRPVGLRGDADNFAKSILDACQEAGLIVNDSQVQTLTVGF